LIRIKSWRPSLTHIFRHQENGAVPPAVSVESREIQIPPINLPGTLNLPSAPAALVVFAHGSGSSRFSPRNMRVAKDLNESAMATLLFDLLTPAEEEDRANVFNIPLLAERLIDIVHWIDRQPDLARLPLGFFGASTGAAAAIVAAAALGDRIRAVVSRGGRPDLAGAALENVRAPTLLIVGGADFGVIELNEQALARLQAPKTMEIVPGASHLFPEPGALEAVIRHAVRWFTHHFGSDDAGAHTRQGDEPCPSPIGPMPAASSPKILPITRTSNRSSLRFHEAACRWLPRSRLRLMRRST
jgi:putative phosphoribosyl transferase